MKSQVCELCNGEAALYCSSDSAFLCWNCDAKVHGANFLVARHVRRTVCSECQGFSGGLFSGERRQLLRSVCRSCTPESVIVDDDVDALSSSSSACISSTDKSSANSPKKTDLGRLKSATVISSSSGNEVSSSKYSIIDWKAEGVLVNWSTKLGLSGSRSSIVVEVARHAFGVCFDRMTVLPYRVGLAALLWFSLRFCEEKSVPTTWQDLKRLGEISGVPAKLIVAAESTLSRILKVRKPRRHHLVEEGWAES